MLEQVAQFVVGDTVIYNPNMPNLKLPHERLGDIAKVIGFEGDYAKVQFLRSGYIGHILITPLRSNYWPFEIYREYALTKIADNIDINKIDE
jgi:hypothetical protein